MIIKKKDVIHPDFESILEKKYGKNALFRLGSNLKNESIDIISTGSIRIDKLLGIGGLPMGKVVELFGEEGTGKTTIALQILAEATKQKKKVLFVDTEHSLNFNYCKKLGIVNQYFYYKQPDNAEEAFSFIKDVAELNAFKIIVLDSVGGLISKQEMENVMDKSVAVIARLMSKFLPSIVSTLNKNNILMLFINQERANVKGSMFFGVQSKTTMGGYSLKYFSSVRIALKRTGYIKKHDDNIGNIVRVKIMKNKFAIPLKQDKINCFFGTGTDKFDEIANIAVEQNIINQSGSWFKFNNEHVGRNIFNIIDKLKDDEVFRQKILKKINIKL